MNDRIMRLADELVGKYSTRNPEAICEQIGVSVVYTELPKSISGFYMENEDAQAIVINEELAPPYSTACLAHELGHAMLHKGINTIFLSDSTNLVVGKYEREADIFAASLLAGGEAAEENDVTIEKLSASTGVPVYAVELWENSKRHT